MAIQQRMLSFTSGYIASMNIEWGVGFAIRSEKDERPKLDDLPASVFLPPRLKRKRGPEQ